MGNTWKTQKFILAQERRSSKKVSVFWGYLTGFWTEHNNHSLAPTCWFLSEAVFLFRHPTKLTSGRSLWHPLSQKKRRRPRPKPGCRYPNCRCRSAAGSSGSHDPKNIDRKTRIGASEKASKKESDSEWPNLVGWSLRANGKKNLPIEECSTILWEKSHPFKCCFLFYLYKRT